MPDWQEHYAEAERLLNAWQRSVNEIDAETDEDLRREFENGSALADQTLSAAQAHATLATIRDDDLTPTAEDLRGAEAEIERLGAVIQQYSPENAATVERVARILNLHLLADYDDDVRVWDDLPDRHRRTFRVAARGVLTALDGAR